MFISLLTYAVLGGLIYYGVRGAWELFKFACRAVVWVVKGIFTIAGALMDYITDTWEEAPEYEPQAADVIKPSPLLEFIQQQEAQGKVEVGETIEIKKKLKSATQNGEVLVLSQVKDSEGKVGVANPKFVKAENGFESKIQNALDRGQIYEQKIKVAS